MPMNWLFCGALTIAVSLAGGLATPAEEAVVYRGARIYTAGGPPIDKGVLITDRGKILAVGREDAVPIPSRATFMI